jgi:hypothetical protein
MKFFFDLTVGFVKDRIECSDPPLLISKSAGTRVLSMQQLICNDEIMSATPRQRFE